MSSAAHSSVASLRVNWRSKAALTFALTAFFCVPYFALQRVVVFPVRTLALSSLDRAIDFDPSWVWAYQSVYLLLAAVPWMSTTREELRKYSAGFVLLSIVGFLFFFFIPVRGPRPDTATPDVMFRFLQSYDRPLNCFPSLHVGLAVYTVLAACVIFRRAPELIRRRISFLGWMWTFAVGYAALATKQHYAIDVATGALLGYACGWSTWHVTQRSTAHAETFLGSSSGSLLGLLRRRDRRISPDGFAAGRGPGR